MGKYYQRLELLAEGVIPITHVLPPPQIPPPPPGTPPLEARLRITFPTGNPRKTASVQIFMVPEGLPILPLPEAPPLVPQSPQDPFTISYAEIEIESARFGASPVPGTSERLSSFAILGKAVSNQVLSPFGDLTGGPTILSGSYRILDEQTGEAEFVFLAAAVAGNHVSVAPTGKGILSRCD